MFGILKKKNQKVLARLNLPLQVVIKLLIDILELVSDGAKLRNQKFSFM
jgi:hypothetical protein